MTATLAIVAAVVWAVLAFGRGGFWRARDDDRAAYAALERLSASGRTIAWPRVVAIVPARDEAALVGSAVASLLQQRYPGPLSVVLVDDHSTDGTADVARRAASAVGAHDRLTVLASPPLARDWTGKLWALEQGVRHCATLEPPPERLLFTDADIRHAPDAVAALVLSAVDEGRVLSSWMVRLRCTSLAERMLVPAFVFFFQMLYPFAWVARVDSRTAAAAGGCVLVDREALVRAGGLPSIRDALIDDCALAARMKAQGPIALALGAAVESLRPYERFDDVRRMVVRSAYAQLRHSPVLLVVVALAMLAIFVAPVALALFADGWTRWLGAATWVAMAALYMPTLRWYRVSPAWAPLLPAIATTYLAFTVESAIAHAAGRGGVWKGRVMGGSRTALPFTKAKD